MIMSMQEARFSIERQILERHTCVSEWRMFPYPSRSGNLVLACCELTDGTDIEQVFDTGVPMDVNMFDEHAMVERFLSMPSREVH